MNPIFVRRINHLTDARYFAAMGVDWMSIGLSSDPGSFMLWHTLKDWVSGVSLAAEIDSADEMVLARTIIDAKPEGIVLKKSDLNDIPSELKIFYEVNSLDEEITETESTRILLYTELTPMDSILKISPDKIYLQTTWSDRVLTQLLSKGYTGGICFLGGEEDMTGVRDYGALDRMFEILER